MGSNFLKIITVIYKNLENEKIKNIKSIFKNIVIVKQIKIFFLKSFLFNNFVYKLFKIKT